MISLKLSIVLVTIIVISSLNLINASFNFNGFNSDINNIEYNEIYFKEFDIDNNYIYEEQLEKQIEKEKERRKTIQEISTKTQTSYSTIVRPNIGSLGCCGGSSSKNPELEEPNSSDDYHSVPETIPEPEPSNSDEVVVTPKPSGGCCGGKGKGKEEKRSIELSTSDKLIKICSNPMTQNIAACSYLYICSVTLEIPDESCKPENLLDFACIADMGIIMKSDPDSMKSDIGVCGSYNHNNNYYNVTYSTLKTQKNLLDSCDSMYMAECSQCPNLESTTDISTCDVHGLYMSLCQSMPGMPGCGDGLFGNVCDPISTNFIVKKECEGTAPMKPSNWDVKTAFSSDGNIEKGDEIEKQPQPIMRMYFHDGLMDYVLFENFVPRTPGQYFGAILFTLFLGLALGLTESIRRYRVKYQAKAFKAHVYEKTRLSNVGTDNCCGGETNGNLSSFTINNDNVGFFASLFGGNKARYPIYWRFQLEKGILRGIELVFAYFLMLIGMTFNVGLFITVIISIALGVTLFDHSDSSETESTGCC